MSTIGDKYLLGPDEVTTIGCVSSVKFMMAELANCCGGPDSFPGTASWSLVVD
jgi:hypothetical protein